MRHVLPILLLLPLLHGCKNSCQQICTRMASYAEDECGMFVSPDEISCCISAQAGSNSAGDRATCRQYGSVEDIADTWTCNDLEDYGPFAGGECDASGTDAPTE